MSQSRRVIVGVVGGSRDPGVEPGSWDQVLREAREVGRLIAVPERGAVVLTGAKPGKRGASPLQIGKIHRNAMRGAIDNGGVAVGVLPRRSQTAVTRRRSVLRIETTLTSHERNFINGTTPDVLIALPGGPGTASEVRIALLHGRPVIFLNSLTVLRRQNRADVQKILDSASQTNPFNVTAAMQLHLGDVAKRSPTMVVDAALGAVGTVTAQTNYPKHPNGAPSKKEFEENFAKL